MKLRAKYCVAQWDRQKLIELRQEVAAPLVGILLTKR